jgi:galactose mutarotase-like enzyme
VVWTLEGGALSLTVTAVNVGAAPVPVGLGWHPYFKLASGDRAKARLRVAARARVVVNNYDEVLPTGVLESVAGSAYNFGGPQGRALGETYLDDCFTDLERAAAVPLAELHDDAAGLGLRLNSPSSEIRALQVFAPPDKPFVVIEPQFNLADPYGAVWGGQDTGMVLLPSGGRATYKVRVEPFAL